MKSKSAEVEVDLAVDVDSKNYDSDADPRVSMTKQVACFLISLFMCSVQIIQVWQILTEIKSFDVAIAFEHLLNETLQQHSDIAHRVYWMRDLIRPLQVHKKYLYN